MSTPAAILSKDDFTSDQDVRWCPGCGDYAILSAIQKVLPDLGRAPHEVVFISGIGCSSRFPYYMDTYGFHTIHGRAPAIATGLKLTRPDLLVWVVTGDGDGLSIGGNHLLHALRRNLDLNYLLFNNEIYGLTKGQYSPTSRVGTVTKSSPFGSTEEPVNPAAFALGAGTTWYGRTVDRDLKHMARLLGDAPRHKGSSFLEIMQNCIVFNDGVYADIYDPKTKADHLLYLEPGQPMIYGRESDQALVIRDGALQPVAVADVAPEEIAVHDLANRSQAWMLAALHRPLPVGVLWQVEQPCFEDAIQAQEAQVLNRQGRGDLQALLHSGVTWEVR